jgi:hypothetical protein
MGKSRASAYENSKVDMTIRIPVEFEGIARDIAVSWNGIGSNFVLVAPPLCEPGHLFKLLRDKNFLESCDLNADKLAIAYMPPSIYSSSLDFVRRALVLWGVIDKNEDIEIDDELEFLEDALSELHDQGKTAVILLPQFHKTIEKLSWTLGARLRELEVNFNLCTVVELPVPLSQLRDRWQLIDDKETFICSDFGQGHSLITLTGYKDSEIESIGKDLHLDKQYIELIQSWAGGLPVLVSWLVLEATRSKSSKQLEHIARQGCLEHSKRFLQWLDAPGGDTFKLHASAIMQKLDDEADRIAMREHVWEGILIDRHGQLRSKAIGHACRAYMGGGCTDYLVSISDMLKRGKGENVEALIDSLPDACRAEIKARLILAIVPVCLLANVLSPNWDKIAKYSNNGVKELKKIDHILSDSITSKLVRWRDFANEISQFKYEIESNSDKKWRLTDSLSGRGKGSDLAAIQLVIYRLRIASRNQDHNSAVKNILEIPEQILQIYCGRKLKINIWESTKLTSDEIDAINNIWKSGDFRPPNLGTRLGFTHLLLIGWIKMEQLSSQDRLFDDYTDLTYWLETYDQRRNQPSHSITFETEADWKEFYSKSIDLTERLAISLLGNFDSDTLPELEEMVSSVAAT